MKSRKHVSLFYQPERLDHVAVRTSLALDSNNVEYTSSWCMIVFGIKCASMNFYVQLW